MHNVRSIMTTLKRSRPTRLLTVRVAPRVRDYVDARARREGNTPSAVVRRLLAHAIEHEQLTTERDRV